MYSAWRPINKRQDLAFSLCACSFIDLSSFNASLDFNMHKEFFHESVALLFAAQWDLTCERKWMASACETVYTIGSIIGLMLSGLSADR